MIQVIESADEFTSFMNVFCKNDSVVIPILSDKTAHPVVNSVCAVFVKIGNEEYILPFHHSEATNLPTSYLGALFTMGKTIYTPSKKTLSHLMSIDGNVVDLKGLEYFQEGECMEESKFHTPYMKFFYGKFYEKKDLNAIVPLMQLSKFCEDYLSHLTKYIPSYNPSNADFKFHNDILIPACQFMERGGVHVDLDKFSEVYGKRSIENVVNDMVYTEYNPYTTTGRVTNHHGGVNFSAIEKKNGTRLAYTTRHERGSLVLIDYESFHLRLIAELTGFELPNLPVHEYLAQQYYGKNTLTQEEYESGKQITFRYLYSTQKEGSEYPFFKYVYEFIENTWDRVQKVGYYQFKSGRKVKINRMKNPSASKLFNYILQWMETEVAMSSLYKISKILEENETKPTLYTYDSVLFDVPVHEKQVLKEIVNTMECGGKYPVRVYAGQNYQELKRIR